MYNPSPILMFCPECGTLAFPTPSGDINCTNYKCGYTGPANVKMKVEGKEIDLSKTKTTTKAEKREYEIIKDEVYCSKVDDTHTVNIHSQLGADRYVSVFYLCFCSYFSL